MLPDGFNLDPAAIPLEQIPQALAALHGLQAALLARLLAAQPAPAAQNNGNGVEDTWLTVAETAQRLRRSDKWVYRRIRALPFARQLGPRSWVFSQRGLTAWIAKQRA